MVRIPDEQAEDARQLHRDMGVLVRERTQHRNRIQSFLFAHGIDMKIQCAIRAAIRAAASLGRSAVTGRTKTATEPRISPIASSRVGSAATAEAAGREAEDRGAEGRGGPQVY